MRLLITADTVGGVWTFAQELVSGLLRGKCAVALVSFGRLPSPAQQRECDALARQWGDAFLFEASEIPLEWMDNNERAYPEGARLLWRVLRDFQPELLLSSQYCYGSLEVPFPRFIVAHSDVLSWAQACRGRRLEPSAWLDRYCSLVARGLSAADGVIAPTRWMLHALGSHFALPAQTRVIPNGRTIPPPAGSRLRTLQAITAGRLWDEAKNIRLLDKVRSPIPLLAAGDSGGQPWGVESRFRGFLPLGNLSQEALLDVFRQSAVYVCASRYEPFGLAPLEAALCGCAILANEIPSLREVWGDAAWYFSGADPLSALLTHLYECPAALALAQERSFTRARQLSANRMVDRYLAYLSPALRGAEAQAYVA